MAEESKLVEEVVETTESTQKKDEFNPLAFAGDENYKEEKQEEEVEKTEGEAEQAKEKVEAKEEKSDSDEKEEGWSWDSNEEEGEKEEEYDWEGSGSEKTEEAPTAQESLDWAKVGAELGVEITSKDEFVKAINALQQQAQQQQAPVSSQVAELKSYLNFSDRDLVAEELKADGIEDAEIEESLDKLEDSGMMKMKAKSIRRVINNAIDQQTAQANQQAEQEKEQRKKQAENAKKELKNQIKNMNEFMGGKVTKKQKEEAYRYATGDMHKEIYANHANVADVAMFMLYRKQIEKILRSQGLEDGKAAIMDSIVSPNLNSGKGKSNFKVKSGGFDPKAFMSE
tara:strand:- start:96 stop:1118 length:1023 start_codon:yes stop_codon:yes gene_type:complete